MADGSSIEWTDATWNPVRGCTKISAGCVHCYAETFSERFRGVPGHPFEFGFDLRLVPEKLDEPFRWARSRRIFVNSMSDLFHESVPDAFIEQVFSVMRCADWHVFQVLTKRPERMRKFVNRRSWIGRASHIWLGVSVEDQKHGLPRIEQLQRTNAASRFLSIEPLLEDLGRLRLEGIHWVIVGGESGPHARPMEEEWVLSIQKHCRKFRVPFFFKQWGRTQKKRAGRKLRGRLYDEFLDVAVADPPDHAERGMRLDAVRRARIGLMRDA